MGGHTGDRGTSGDAGMPQSCRALMLKAHMAVQTYIFDRRSVSECARKRARTRLCACTMRARVEVGRYGLSGVCEAFKSVASACMRTAASGHHAAATLCACPLLPSSSACRIIIEGFEICGDDMMVLWVVVEKKLVGDGQLRSFCL